jgi:hypothetical protein
MATQYSKIAERLLTHAKLCRRIAASGNDDGIACKLLEMAEECVRAAAEELALARLRTPETAPVVSNWNSPPNPNA